MADENGLPSGDGGPYRIPGEGQELPFLPGGKRYGFKRRTTVTWGRKIPMHVLTDLMVKPGGYHLDFNPEWCRQVQLRPLVLLATVVPEGVQLGIMVNGKRCADISGTASAIASVDGAMPGVFRMPTPIVVNARDTLGFHLEFETGVLWNGNDYQEHPKGVLLAWYGVNTVDVP